MQRHVRTAVYSTNVYSTLARLRYGKLPDTILRVDYYTIAEAVDEPGYK